MGIITGVVVCAICAAVVYIAFKHVSYHEKNDRKLVKSIIKNKKVKNNMQSIKNFLYISRYK